MKTTAGRKPTVGWREWVSLPTLGIPAIKAKIDTGARTSALHAFQIDRFREHRTDKVRFSIHPVQRRRDIVLTCVTPLLDFRYVTDSGGHRERRYVIRSSIRADVMEWDVELTLTDRDTMLFRMLLGRTAVRRRYLVDPGRSFLLGRKLAGVYTASGRPASPEKGETP